MKATGIVRRIDDLGRVVIPKEIRRTMRIREGDPLEIYTSAGGEVIFKKYSPIGELSEFSGQFAEAIGKYTNLTVAICDRDHCIAAAGANKKDIIEKSVTPELENIMEGRTAKTFSGEQSVFGILGYNKNICFAAPIVANGDIAGVVTLLAGENNPEANESDINLAKAAALFLSKQLEQ